MIQTKIKSKLTAPIFIISLLFLLIGCNEKEADSYREVEEFNEGLPQALEPFEKDLPFENFSYANLETGLDSLQVIFGTLQQGTTKGYWISLISDGVPAQFSAINLDKIDSLDYRTKDIDIEFNQERNRVSVRIVEMDSLTNKIKYSWLDDSNPTKKVVVKRIERPLRMDAQLPEMNLESINDQQIPSSQFKNKFIVINWWATYCAPCIKEIPELNEIVEKYRNNDNVRFIAVTDDPKSRIVEFLKNKDFNYEMTFANSEVRTLFGNSYPINIIIDPTGTITYLNKGAGPDTPSQIEASLSQQLNEYYLRK